MKTAGDGFWIIIVAGVILHALSMTKAHAQGLDVPVIEKSSGDLDTCGYGQVTGLKSWGDGFLAVRSGPSSKYKKLDELHNGDQVWMFEQRGNWIGIAYAARDLECSPIPADRILNKPGKKGWVHKNWIRLIAG